MLSIENQAQPLLSACVVFVTCPSLDEAEKLAAAIVTESLAACVNLILGVRSIYQWPDALGQLQLCQEQEVQLVIKTQPHLLSDLETKIITLHSYDVPEFVVLPIIAGSEPYLNWITKMTKIENREKGNKQNKALN